MLSASLNKIFPSFLPVLLEKAYDPPVWDHEGPPTFINNLLKDSSFKVCLKSTFSDTHSQEMGVPQDSILSVTIFSVTALPSV